MPAVGKWALLLGLLFPLAWAKNENYQMNDVCKNHFLRDLYRKIDGAVLTSQNERNLDCAITFQTHSILQRFMLRFDRLQLDCNDHLYIYDGAHAVGNYKVDLSCRSTESSVSALYTRTNFVTLKYVTDAWGTDTNGFRLVISAIKDPKHACKDFRCTTKEFCIDTDLVCDGIRHCEDGSDEAASTLCANPEASTILGMEKTLFAVAMVFIVLSMVGIVAAGVLCFCRQRTATPRHSHNAHNAQTHPPVIFPCEDPATEEEGEHPIKEKADSHQDIKENQPTKGEQQNQEDQITEDQEPTQQKYSKTKEGNSQEELKTEKQHQNHPLKEEQEYHQEHQENQKTEEQHQDQITEEEEQTKEGKRKPKQIQISWLKCPLSQKIIMLILSLFLITTTFLHDVLAQIPDLASLIEKTNQTSRDFLLGPCLVKTNNTCPDPEVQFFLYTKSNPETAEQIFLNNTESNLSQTNFSSSNPTKIIIHGYNSDMQLDSLVDIRNEYLKRDQDHNLIAVDWHRLATGPCYPVAVHNVPHVGSCLAQLINRIRETGAEDIHAIGFSLGAHVPAFSANELKPYKLPRITGLDPALPLFVTVGNDEKLDKGDADFVDVFHTNAFIQGKVETVGHIDFYMNGGINQPGCWQKRNPFGCNHHRAAMYFAESVNSEKGFWGWPCPGFLAYLLGLCPPRFPAVLAGDKVNKNYTGFHLVKTHSKSPFAEGVFQISDRRKRMALRLGFINNF